MHNRDGEMWLTCEQFAALTNMPQRTARYALSSAAKGKPVKNWQISVNSKHGRGGRSGIRYEVALSSLSEALQNAFWEAAGCSRNVPAVLDAAPRTMPRVRTR